MPNTSLAVAAANVAKLKSRYESLAKQAAAAKLDFDKEHAALYERMEHEDVGSIKVGEINFVRAQTVYGNVQDRSAFVAWALENAPEMIEHKERAKVLNELVRERVEQGEALPDGVGFYVKQYVGQRAA